MLATAALDSAVCYLKGAGRLSRETSAASDVKNDGAHCKLEGPCSVFVECKQLTLFTQVPIYVVSVLAVR